MEGYIRKVASQGEEQEEEGEDSSPVQTSILHVK